MSEPDGERAIFCNPRTAIGGHLSRDITRRYGPEEYLLHVAPPGTYTVKANAFVPDRLDPNGATLLTAHLIHDYGRITERDGAMEVELSTTRPGPR